MSSLLKNDVSLIDFPERHVTRQWRKSVKNERSSPPTGFPVSFERTPWSGETKTKMEKEYQKEQYSVDPERNCS
jgi:hypothetical protein